jgi:hypothetical protein
MANQILITAGPISLKATLNESDTARSIFEALPIDGRVNRWGDEIYFSIPIQLSEDKDARQDMEVGELGYWPVGKAFCIFFGRTPVSQGENPRAYSNVNPFGKIEGDATRFREVTDNENIRITKI